METQVHMEMAHREFQEERTKEPVEEITEEQFLKDLYFFMKKRDTPIERIPHLGFKQIDLFLMFKTVSDWGGYNQVTAQQLWKQVYNTLGGNPRSTSAATCTRRHYEKLLLPYECHVKGILMMPVPSHQPKPFIYANYRKDGDDGQRPAKRKMLSIPMHQSPHNLQSEPHGSILRLPLHHPQYYYPSHTALASCVHVSSSVLTPPRPPASKLPFPFHPSRLDLTDRVKEPLEHLRYLAERYKTSSGLTEPLNLSVKASTQETNSNPISSFAPPPSSKNPKFLNKPSTLYSPHHAGSLRNEGCETQDDDSCEAITPSSYPVKAGVSHVIDVEALTDSRSPIYSSAPTLGADKDASAMAQKNSSLKTEFTIRPKEEREPSPEVRGLSLSHILPGLPRQKDGKMEFEIPLSVFHNWLKMYRSPIMMDEAQEPPPPPPPPPTLEEESGERNWSDILPTDLTFHMNPPHQSSAEDLSMRNVPSPTPTTQTTGNNHSTSQNCFSSYRPSPSCSILKNSPSRDICSLARQDIDQSYNSEPTNLWGAYDKEIQAASIQVGTSPLRGQQDFASKLYTEGIDQGGKQKSDTGPSALLMVNSSPASVLHLTTEEVIRLKKIISSPL